MRLLRLYLWPLLVLACLLSLLALSYYPSKINEAKKPEPTKKVEYRVEVTPTMIHIEVIP